MLSATKLMKQPFYWSTCKVTRIPPLSTLHYVFLQLFFILFKPDRQHREEKDSYTLKPCISQAHFIWEDDPHHLIRRRDILALIHLDSRNISIIFESCFFFIVCGFGTVFVKRMCVRVISIEIKWGRASKHSSRIIIESNKMSCPRNVTKSTS